MNFDTIFAQIKQVLHSGAGAKFSIGNPMKVGDLSVVPVAKVSFAFGGGGGSSAGKPKKKTTDKSHAKSPSPEEVKANNADFGGGGGGGIKTEPIGIYTIKDERVKFYPIITIREILTISGIVIILLLKIKRLTQKR